MIVTLQTSIVLLVGLPLLAVFQPFLPGLPSAALFLGILLVLAVFFWRGTADLEGHVKAVSQVIVENLAKQAQEKGTVEDDKDLRRTRKLFTGMGHIATLTVGPGFHCVGKTMGELNIRSLTGAAILVVMRGEGNSILPSSEDILQAGDLVTLAGTPEAVEAAKAILTGGTETTR